MLFEVRPADPFVLAGSPLSSWPWLFAPASSRPSAGSGVPPAALLRNEEAAHSGALTLSMK
jgi:hypothetical protein